MLARRQDDTKTGRPLLSGITVFCFAAWFAVSTLAAPKHAERAIRGLASPKHAQRAQAGASRFALALVNDPKGKAIVDIGQDDFVVQEGNVTREVLDVRVADYPVVLVLDNGAAASADFSAIKAAAIRFVERIGQRPLAIVTTAGAPNLIAAFEDEHDTLAEKIEAIDPPRAADGQPLRALALAARTISATGALFSTIVLATASPIEVGGTAAEEFVAPIVDSRAVVHVVANDRGVAATGQTLRGLAQQTRGGYTPIFAAPSYTPALERLVVRLTSELLIEYIVPVGSHAVDPKIGVRIPGARVRGLGVAPR
jgi:hypothetical protein